MIAYLICTCASSNATGEIMSDTTRPKMANGILSSSTSCMGAIYRYESFCELWAVASISSNRKTVVQKSIFSLKLKLENRLDDGYFEVHCFNTQKT